MFNKRIPEESFNLQNNTVPFTQHVIDELFFTAEDISNLLCSIDVNKANGPDGIPLRVFKECSSELAPSSAGLFNYSLDLGYLNIGR